MNLTSAPTGEVVALSNYLTTSVSIRYDTLHPFGLSNSWKGQGMQQRQLPIFNTSTTTYDDIIDIFLKGETLTLRAICTRCGRAKTPRMAQLVLELVNAGILLKTPFTAPNGVTGYEYSIIADDRAS